MIVNLYHLNCNFRCSICTIVDSAHDKMMEMDIIEPVLVIHSNTIS